MTRFLARRVLWQGREYPLSVVEISDDKKKVCLSPFRAETYSTKFIDGTVIIEQGPDGLYYFREL